MDEFEDLKTRTTEDYFQESVRDLTFDEINLMEHCRSIGPKIAKWARYLYEESRVVEYGKQTYAVLYKKAFHKYRFEESEISQYKVDKKDIDIYIEADKAIKDCKIMLKAQEEKCKFLQSVIDALKNQSFLVNNMVKFLIYRSGADQ